LIQLTPRRRFVVALLLSWPIGLLYLYWLWVNGVNVLRWYRGGYVDCSPSLLTATNGCGPGSYSVVFAWVQLIVVSAIIVAIGAMLGRWVLRPVATMADTVDRLGPTSLGMRLDASGPRDETRRLAQAINVMLDRVAEGYEAQQRFAANASHELRTPLATQRALIEISLGEALTPDQLQLVSRQLLATNARNEALIDGLLTLAETERGLVVKGPQRLDLIAAATVETLRPDAEQRGIELGASLDSVEVAGEAPLLERLVTNLVQNAVKYNDANGWVRIVVTADGRLTVANSGPSVAPDRVAGLFEPFRRGSRDRLDHGGGVGLGLTIARSVVAAHHGTICARANTGGGLTVDVGLPVIQRGALRSDSGAR
jgi:signal transduction histidine kinase